MKIVRATFLGIRGVSDGTYDFTHPTTGAPNSLVLVTGPEASGKTSFLEAIVAAKEAIGAYGPMSPGATWIASGGVIAKVMLSFALDDDERHYVGTSESVVDGEATFLPERVRRDADEGLVALLARYEHGVKCGKMEYFPSSRRILPLGPFHGTGVVEQRMQRASKEITKYGFIVRFLRELNQLPAAQKAFAEHLARLSPTCRYVPSEPNSGLPRCFATRGIAGATMSELSETEQHCIIFAATAVAIGLSKSLILIDRPEASTSPSRAGAFLEALSMLGDDNQIIMASFSNEILAAVPRTNIIRLEGT